MLRNVAGQRWRVYAWNVTTGLPKTGEEDNITAIITIDAGVPAVQDGIVPTEVDPTNEPGYYDFFLTQAETNGQKLSLSPTCSTANIVVIACPPVVYTIPNRFSLLGVESDGAVTKVDLVDTTTTNTDMRGTDSAALASALSTHDGKLDTLTTTVGAAGAGLTEAGGDGDHLTAINLPNQTMDIVGNITGNLSGSVGSVTGAVGSVTGSVGGNVTGSVGSLATQAKADVNAEADSAIETYHLDHLLAATYDPASKPGASDSLLNELVESDAGVSRFTANALEEAPTGGSAPTVEEIRTEMDDNSTKLAAIVADTNELQTDDVPGLIAALNNLSQANVRTAVGLGSANLDTQLDAIPTAAENRAEMDSNSTRLAAIEGDTNELQSDWANNGRLDLILDARASQASVDLAQDDLDILTGIDGALLDSATTDVYHSDIDLTLDEANTRDEYSVTWFKNGVRVTTGITSPLIQVVKRADGTDLVASTAMTQIGSTGSYKYDEATNRITNGEAVLVIVTGTIDGSARSFARVLGRDASS